MDLGLKDKVVAVAAASQGLGFGIAKSLAEEGAKLSICSRNAASIEEAKGKLVASGAKDVQGHVCDVRLNASVQNWLKHTYQHFNRLDGLVVNAGGPPAGKFADFDDAAWQAAFELTLMSSVRMIREALPYFRKNGSGSIVVITSTSVKEPMDLLLLSNVMRSGVSSLIKSLSHDISRENIRINNLIPGRIDTERVRHLDQKTAEKKGISAEQVEKDWQAVIPMGRYGTSEEFGRVGAFLLSEVSSYITGASIVVDGGKTRSI